MANPIIQSISATGTYVFAVDYYVNPFNLAWDVDLGSGTATYSIDATLDPINDTPGQGYGVVVSASPSWDITVQASGSAAASGNFQTPVQAVRLDVTAITGTITVKFLQPFSIN